MRELTEREYEKCKENDIQFVELSGTTIDAHNTIIEVLDKIETIILDFNDCVEIIWHMNNNTINFSVEDVGDIGSILDNDGEILEMILQAFENGKQRHGWEWRSESSLCNEIDMDCDIEEIHNCLESNDIFIKSDNGLKWKVST